MTLHESLRDRAVLELYLKPALERGIPLHVGTGGEGEFLKAQLRFVVDGRPVPFVPSESIKGVLRAEASRLAKVLRFSSQTANELVRIHSKDRHEDYQVASEQVERLLAQLYYTEEQLEEIKSSQNTLRELYASYYCPICRLFGSRHIAGKLLLTDAMPVTRYSASGRLQMPPTDVYMSTAINRKTRTVEGERLFALEYIVLTDEFRFRFDVIADNLLHNDEAMLFASLLEYLLEAGLMLGGGKSRGYGWMQLDEDMSRVKFIELKPNPTSYDEKMDNVRKLLLAEGSCRIFKLREFIRELGSCFTV